MFEDGAYRGTSSPKYYDEYPSAPDEAGEYNDVYDEFRVYWNVPTFQCHRHGYNFTDVSEWGIQHNEGDSFRGDKISLLYDPGLFPALLQGGSSPGDYVIRNGGVPHEGNITKHLDLFAQDLVTKLIPDPNFSGKRSPSPDRGVSN